MPAPGRASVHDLRRAWQRLRAWQTALACWLGALGCLVGAVNGWAYRPFFSTDAAVADPQEAEIELGYFTLEQAQGQQTSTLPSLVLNYGLCRDIEVVGEFAVARDHAGELNIVDPGLFVKAVLKEGVLQEKEGLSVAVEAGPLLPSTRPGERLVGIEAIGIVSGRVAPFTLHVNGGGGIERTGAQPFGIWGVIGELHVHPRFRLVGEVAGEGTRGGAPEQLCAARHHLAGCGRICLSGCRRAARHQPRRSGLAIHGRRDRGLLAPLSAGNSMALRVRPDHLATVPCPRHGSGNSVSSGS
jgi:hypothetical protein